MTSSPSRHAAWSTPHKPCRPSPQTRTVLGFFRSGDREFAQYPGMVFRLGPAMRERRAAVHKALKDTDFDVMVNPKYIVQTKRRPFVRTVTVQVAGYGGHLVFEQPSEE